MWLGLAVHDTAQVMGAGLTYAQLFDDERAFNAAAVTKLTRNLALAAAIPALAFAHEQTVRPGNGSGGDGVEKGAGIFVGVRGHGARAVVRGLVLRRRGEGRFGGPGRRRGRLDATRRGRVVEAGHERVGRGGSGPRRASPRRSPRWV